MIGFLIIAKKWSALRWYWRRPHTGDTRNFKLCSIFSWSIIGAIDFQLIFSIDRYHKEDSNIVQEIYGVFYKSLGFCFFFPCYAAVCINKAHMEIFHRNLSLPSSRRQWVRICFLWRCPLQCMALCLLSVRVELLGSRQVCSVISVCWSHG